MLESPQIQTLQSFHYRPFKTQRPSMTLLYSPSLQKCNLVWKVALVYGPGIQKDRTMQCIVLALCIHTPGNLLFGACSKCGAVFRRNDSLVQLDLNFPILVLAEASEQTLRELKASLRLRQIPFRIGTTLDLTRSVAEQTSLSA